MSEEYSFLEIERSMQELWRTEDRYAATEDSTREKFYCLAMFPYPSGRLHMGHVRNYTISDAIARYQRQLGRNVLHPIGWDAFGLPAENAANQRGVDPRQWTSQNIDYMRGQLKRMGMSYDWRRELSTCEPDYYRWEQWFFGKLYDQGMIYRRQSQVNWDPVDQTVLANEQVVDGCGWRSGAQIERRTIEQWFVRITSYAEELLQGLDKLTGWPSQVVQMQRNWIGRSEGTQITFALLNREQSLEVFTTRADTLYGVVALMVSSRHSLVEQCVVDDPALKKAVAEMDQLPLSEAALATTEKIGYRLAVEAIHPLSGEKLPVYVANYVLSEYGSGVVMSVPAHDKRDFEFARQHHLPIRAVVLPEDQSLDQNTDQWQEAFVEDGVLTGSDQFNGMTSTRARQAITEKLVQSHCGRAKITYRLRDWGVSRQRYWGCPIPIVYDQNGQASLSDELPVTLPTLLPSKSKEQSLIRLQDHPDFSPQRLPRRETDTLDTFFESSWYYARFCSYDCDQAMVDQRVRYWLPIDQYVGGIEHAVLHLLYFRFFHKLMRDAGLVTGDEPATRLLTQGMVVAQTWSLRDDQGHQQWVNEQDLEVERDKKGKVVSAVHRATGRKVNDEGLRKMSKSKNNGVDPDQLLTLYGADATRLYTLFTAPPDQALEWSSANISGCTRFLRRLHSYVLRYQSRLTPLTQSPIGATEAGTAAARHQLHSLLRKALYDYQRNQFNTVVAATMEMMNLLYKNDTSSTDEFRREVISVVLRLLAPMTPHLTCYLWRRLQPDCDIEQSGMPVVDPDALVEDEIEYQLQVNSRRRAAISLAANCDQETVSQSALDYCQKNNLIPANSEVTKVIVVKKKLVNVVCRAT